MVGFGFMRLGGVRAASAGGGDPDPELPTPIAVADFKGGSYKIGSASVPVADMFPGTLSVTPGIGLVEVGWTNFAAPFWDAISDGFSMLIEWEPLADGEFSAKMEFSYAVTSDWNEFRQLTLDSFPTGEPPSGKATVMSGAGSVYDDLSIAPHRTAATFSDALLAISTDGAEAITQSTSAGSYNGDASLSCNVGVVVSKMTFYAPQDATTLQALSA